MPAADISISNHQDAVPLPPPWLARLTLAAHAALPLALARATGPDTPLAALDCVEIAFVDDETSDRVHRDFMDIAGPTDVITFHHGEIVIGAEVAARQAAEYGEPLERELARYIVHGLLHLAGHDDGTPQARAPMEQAQEEIVAAVCKTAGIA